MAEFLTLDEAARALGIDPEELKLKAKDRKIRGFLDGGSWRFRKSDINDLVKKQQGSDPDISLSDLDLDIPADPGSSEEVSLSDFELPVSEAGVEIKSDDDILLDESSLPAPATGSSSTIIGMKPSGKKPSDSDVKVLPEGGPLKGASDSDVRIAPAPPTRPDMPSRKGAGSGSGDSDVTLVSDEQSASFDALPIDDPNATTLRKSPLLGSSDEIDASGSGPVEEPSSDSDFELTPSSVIDALQPESGSDFELTALDASDDIVVPTKRGPSDSDVTGAEPSSSGINLGRPSDSGINLQAMGSLDMGHDSIELAPLEDESVETPAAKKPAPKPKAPPKQDPGATSLPIKQQDDPSATALPIKPLAEKDIFEDTDFEVDAFDSDEGPEDRTVQLENQSDFDIEESDSSGSEVFAIDEEDVDLNAATAMGPAQLEEDEEFSEEGISGEVESAWGDVSGDQDVTATPSPAAGRAVPSPALAPRDASPEWGGLWVSFLGVSAVLMLLVAFVGMDLVTNLYEFRGSTNFIGSGLVRQIAGMFGAS